MAVRNSRSAASDHRRHDRLLVARFATGDAEFGQEREAVELVRRCGECADLAADIKRISQSVAQLPAPRRTRDFRLTAEQADKLRGSAFERFFRTLTGSGWTVLRPVAGVALSIGLVMSVVGYLPILGGAGLAGAPAAAPTSGENDSPGFEQFPMASDMDAQPPQESPRAGVEDPNRSEVATAADNLDNAYVVPKGSPAPALGPTGQAPSARDVGLNSRDMLFIGGLAMSALAVAVLALLYAARRRFTDPLLR